MNFLELVLLKEDEIWEKGLNFPFFFFYQVTMYRQYRVGELPDVQIPHRALIGPLQALSQVCCYL